MNRKNVILIGPMPPPRGGVSTHLFRLLERSGAAEDINLSVFDIRRMRLHKLDMSTRNPFRILRELIHAHIIHLHISRKLKLFLAIMVKSTGKKLVYTHHNSRDLTDSLTLRTMDKADKIILVLPLMDELPEKLREKCLVIPAYLPGISNGVLPSELTEAFSSGTVIFSLCYQKKESPLLIDGKDLYGFDLIFDALEILAGENTLPEIVLFLADPADAMKTYFRRQINDLNAKPGLKIVYWNKELDFYAALKHCSVLIRASRSDGDAISIREALNSGISVIASDCVERPEGVMLFATGNAASLAEAMRNFFKHPQGSTFPQPDLAPGLFSLYRTI